MRPLSDASGRIASANFSRKYIAIGKIVNCWAEIMGAEMADKAQPVRLQYRQQRTRKDKPSATLEVACASAFSTSLHYQKDLILERIHRIFGERWISEIKFVPSEMAPSKPLRRSRKTRPLQGSDHDYLKEILGQIDDADIKQRLERLGQNILMDEHR